MIFTILHNILYHFLPIIFLQEELLSGLYFAGNVRIFI